MSPNLLVQILSALLWILALSGLQINPDEIANQTVTAIVTKNYSLLMIALLNFGNSVFYWYRTWQTDRPNFSQFLRSPNWWISFCNILFSYVAYKGIVLPADTSATVVNYVFNKQWWELLGFLFPNVIGPVIRFFTEPKIIEAEL